MTEVREFVKGLVQGIIGVVIAVNLVPVLTSALDQVTGIPLLSSALVGVIVGAGILMFVLTVFL